jgi:hypothetical protein
MLRFRSSLLVLCLFLLPLCVFAQEAPPPTEKELAAERQGREMLESVAGSIPNLRSSDNRIFLEAAVADLMWTRDEKRARDLYEMLTKEIGAVMATLDGSDLQSSPAFSSLQQQRREIVERMARRDAEMALTFLRATRPPAEFRVRNNDYNNEANLELHLAGLLAAKDPDVALQLARTNLKKGVTYPLVSTMTQILASKPDAGRLLYSEMVDKLRTSDIVENYDSANAAWNLLGALQPPQANEDAYRNLIELIGSTALSLKPDVRNGNGIMQTFAGQVSSYMPQFLKYAPSRAAALKQWSDQVKRTLDPSSLGYQEISEVSQKGSVDDLLALTEKFGKDYHNHIYQQAVYKAVAAGDVARARQIINERVTDLNQRRQMLDQVENQLFWAAANQNKIAEARDTIRRIKNSDQRFQLLMGLVMNLLNRSEKSEAAGLLAEAMSLVDGLPANSTKLSAKLQLAQAFASVDPQQSVAILQSVIVLSNQLVAAAAVLDGFENTYLREGEWMKRGYSNLGNVVSNIQQNLGSLARVDSDGARALSEQIERPEIRLMAQLEIAKSLLEPNTNPNFNRLILHSNRGLH